MDKIISSNKFGLLLDFITPTTIFVFFCVLFLVNYVMKLPRSLNMPPGPFPFPVIGNFHEFIRKPDKGDLHVIQSLARKYGKLFSMKMGSHNTIVISDYRLLVDAFVKKSDVFSDRPIDLFYSLSHINNKVGTGIVSNNGPSWKTLRRTALVTMRDFGVGKRSLEEKIQEEIRVFLDVLGKHKNEPFYIKPLFSYVTSNIICQVVFGSRFDYEDEKFKELVRILDSSLRKNPLSAPVNFFPFLRHIPLFTKSIDEFTHSQLLTVEYVKRLAASNEPTFDPENIRDFVDLFIKMRREHPQDETFDERSMARVIIDLFSAGTDTSSNALEWAMVYMARYPEVQERCQQEIDQVLGKGKLLSAADKENIPYTEATTLEILRIRPIAPLSVPRSTSKDTEFHGYFIPQNTIVLPNLLSINMDPEIFHESQQFDPEHFLNKEGRVINRDRLLTFSIGPRACMAESLAKMEMLLIFASVLQFFTISPEPGKPPDVSGVRRASKQNLVYTQRE